MANLCFAGPGCMGCGFCDFPQDDSLRKKQEEKRINDKLRLEGKPTLHVSLGEILKLKINL